MKKLFIVSILLLAGCATTNPETVNKLQTALNYAKGIQAVVSVVVQKYDQRPICGEPAAVGKSCKDLNRSQFANKITASLKITIDEAQTQLTNLGPGGVDAAKLSASLISAAISAFEIVEIFSTTDP